MDVKLYLYPEYTDREPEQAAIDLGIAAEEVPGIDPRDFDEGKGRGAMTWSRALVTHPKAFLRGTGTSVRLPAF